MGLLAKAARGILAVDEASSRRPIGVSSTIGGVDDKNSR